MKKSIVLGSVLLCAAHGFAAEKAKPASGAGVFVTADELKWVDVPGMKGIKTATVEGASDKGPHHMYMKFAGGFSAGMHHHSPNHYVTVVSGTMVLTTEGKEHKLGPGSYFAFSDKLPHATKCEAGPDCVIFLDVREKWDVVPEEQAKADVKK